jgi:hypothetical protein
LLLTGICVVTAIPGLILTTVLTLENPPITSKLLKKGVPNFDFLSGSLFKMIMKKYFHWKYEK